MSDPLDLDAIKARKMRSRCGDDDDARRVLVGQDIPALIAEVERLRALIAQHTQPAEETDGSTAVYDQHPEHGRRFLGHDPNEGCQHRTVGEHRAWCHDCGEWCYPRLPCVRCERAIQSVNA